MESTLTRSELLSVLFNEIDDENNTRALNPPEIESKWTDFTDKWIDTAYPSKSHFEEQDKAHYDLWQMIQAYKKNAFVVGFNTALELMQKGAATV